MSENCDLLIDYFNNQLTKEQAEEFELHLSTCSSCEEELNELRELTADLPYSSEPVQPPEDMKERVLGNIIKDTKEDEPTPEKTDHQENSPTGQEYVSIEKKKSRLYQPLIAAVLTLSLVGNAVAVIYVTDDEQEETAPETSDTLDSMQEMIALSPSEGIQADATAMMIEQEKDVNLVIQAENLPSLEGDQTYQVWLLQDGEPSRAGTFILNEKGIGGTSYVLRNDTKQNWDTIAITKEPDANSQTPKGDIVLSAPL